MQAPTSAWCRVSGKVHAATRPCVAEQGSLPWLPFRVTGLLVGNSHDRSMVRDRCQWQAQGEEHWIYDPQWVQLLTLANRETSPSQSIKLPALPSRQLKLGQIIIRVPLIH